MTTKRKAQQGTKHRLADEYDAAQEGGTRYLTIYEGRELIGSVVGAGRDWRALDARGRALPGAPFKSEIVAVAALNAARPGPCAADARLDNS